MKHRTGFISNSSSSSFIVRKEGLSEFQKYIVVNHCEVAKTLRQYEMISANKYVWIRDWWDIEDKGDYYLCSTFMDNFPLDEFLAEFGIEIMDRKHSNEI